MKAQISELREKIKVNYQKVDSNCHQWQKVRSHIEKLQTGLRKTKLAHSSALRQLDSDLQGVNCTIEIPSEGLRHHPSNKYATISRKIRHLQYQQRTQPMKKAEIKDNQASRLHYKKSLEKLAEDFPHTVGGRNAKWFLENQSHFFPEDSSS